MSFIPMSSVNRLTTFWNFRLLTKNSLNSSVTFDQNYKHISIPLSKNCFKILGFVMTNCLQNSLDIMHPIEMLKLKKNNKVVSAFTFYILFYFLESSNDLKGKCYIDVIWFQFLCNITLPLSVLSWLFCLYKLNHKSK